MKQFALIILLIFLLGSIYATPKFRIDKSYWNFGKVEEGVKIHQQLKIKNSGDEELIVKVRSSCECVKLTAERFKIKPGKEKLLKITFDTTDYSGKKTEYVFFDTNDPEAKYLVWVIEGEILSEISHARPSSGVSPGLSTTEFPSEQIKLKLFFTSGCKSCLKFKEKILPEFERKLNIKIELEEYPLEDIKNYELLLTIENQLQDEDNKLPVVVIGNKILSGESEIIKYLEAEIKKAAKLPAKPLPVEHSPEVIKHRLKSISIFAILSAGFVDGLNPCAFAAIVFLIAYLSMIKKKKTIEVFYMGLAFIFGVFITYFLIGLGLNKFLSVIGLKGRWSVVVYLLTGVFTLILSILSFLDFIAIKRLEQGDKNSRVILQLPNYFRGKIYSAVEKYASMKYLILTGFILGFLISLLEFFCTGQIYLPTIIYMFSQSEGVGALQLKAVTFLVVYCFMFVLPLIVIFVLLLFGLKSEIIESIGRRHIATVKIATGIVFLVLSILMFSVAL